MIMGKCKCGVECRGAALRYDGDVAMTVFMCGKCRDKVNALLKRLKPVKQAMVDAGVPWEVGSRAMNVLLDGME